MRPACPICFRLTRAWSPVFLVPRPLKSFKMQTYFGVKVGSHEAYFSVTFSPFGLIIALVFFVFLLGVWNLYRDGLLLSTFYLLVGSDFHARPRTLYSPTY